MPSGPSDVTDLSHDLPRRSLAIRETSGPGRAPPGPRPRTLATASLHRSPAAHPLHNLPSQPTVLVGREQEVETLCQRLLSRNVRLLSLTGAPGVGKTRLALAVAASVLGAFRDGAFFVDLAPISNPGLVIPTIAQVLGVREAGVGPPLQRLQEYLEDKTLLLLLDNFEQVLDAGPQIADLLVKCPELRVLVTTREALRLRWEQVFSVPPLRVPDVDRLPRPEDLADCPSVRLFVQRAEAVKPDFVLDQQNARPVAEVCARLDGIPLAIELAAAQADVMAPRDMLEGLQQGLALLVGGPKDLPLRQQTLRKAIAWSYDLLAPEEQQVLRRLAVFVGGGTVLGAQAVCALGETARADVPGVLRSLVRKSLLRLEGEEGEQRFALLEMIRQYGLEESAAACDRDVARSRHAAHFLQLAEQAAPHLDGPEQQDWLGRLGQEHDNLRAALSWFRERVDVEDGLRLAVALWRFWRTCAHFSEGRAQLEGLLDLAADLSETGLRARALIAAGDLAHVGGEHSLANAHFEQGMAVFKKLGDRSGMAWAMLYMAVPLMYDGDLAAASALAGESLTLLRQMGDQRGIGMALNTTAQVAILAGNYQGARSTLEESLAVSRPRGDKWVISTSLTLLAGALTALGDYTSSRLAAIEGLTIGHELGDAYRIAFALEVLAILAAAVGQHNRAAKLHGAASGLRQTVLAPLSTYYNATIIERRLEPARRALGKAAYAAAFVAGRTLSIEEAIEYALAGEPQPAPSSPGGEGSGAAGAGLLTRREREVAGLIVRGLTNGQIAGTLVISKRTVETHVSNILSKLGLTSRSQIVAWILEQGLPPAKS